MGDRERTDEPSDVDGGPRVDVEMEDAEEAGRPRLGSIPSVADEAAGLAMVETLVAGRVEL